MMKPDFIFRGGSTVLVDLNDGRVRRVIRKSITDEHRLKRYRGFLLGDPGFDPQLAEEFWRAFGTAAMITLHIRMVSGKNTHHIIEASFKGLARTLRDAVRVEGTSVPSTKGVL